MILADLPDAQVMPSEYVPSSLREYSNDVKRRTILKGIIVSAAVVALDIVGKLPGSKPRVASAWISNDLHPNQCAYITGHRPNPWQEASPGCVNGIYCGADGYFTWYNYDQVQNWQTQPGIQTYGDSSPCFPNPSSHDWWRCAFWEGGSAGAYHRQDYNYNPYPWWEQFWRIYACSNRNDQIGYNGWTWSWGNGTWHKCADGGHNWFLIWSWNSVIYLWGDGWSHCRSYWSGSQYIYG
jgi:hypothetical protein